MSLSLPVPLDQLANSGSTMTIEETVSTTPGGGPRRVVLAGGGLPFMGGADWGGESKLVTTWYPGNGEEASQQKLGETEMPSQWTGEWNRTRMGRAPTTYTDETGARHGIVDPGELWTVLEDIRRAGARLRVTWSVKGRVLVGNRGAGDLSIAGGTDRPVDFQIVREGRMKSLKITPDRVTDFKWAAAWEWMSRGKRLTRVADARRDSDVALASTAVAQSISALEDLVSAAKLVQSAKGIRLSASVLSLGKLEAIAGAPLAELNKTMAKLRYGVNQIKRVGDLAKKFATIPDALSNSVMDFAKNTAAVCHQFADSHGRRPVELLSTRQRPSEILRATRHFARVADGMLFSAKAATDLDLRLRQVLVTAANRGTLSVRASSTTRAGDILAIYTCKTGDTPSRVSSKFYANADHGATILRANRLPPHTPTFRTGQILVIPAAT